MGQFIRIVKADDDTRRERRMSQTEKGFKSLAPYMEAAVAEYEANAEDQDAIVQLYEDIINANNIILGRGLGMSMEEMEAEGEDGTPALLAEPFINAPVMMHLKRLSAQFPELKEVREEDEKVGEPLDDIMKRGGGIRADISSFIADPINSGENYKQHEIKGIQNLLSKYDHPLGVTLSLAVPKSDRIAPNYTPRPPRKRMIQTRGPLTDKGFEEAINRLRDEQQRALEEVNPTDEEGKRFLLDEKMKEVYEKLVRDGLAQGLSEKQAITRAKSMQTQMQSDQSARDYERYFRNLEMDQQGKKDPVFNERRSSVQIARPSTQSTQEILSQVARLRLQGLDEKAAFRSIQDKFNQYMVSLTGEDGFGAKTTRRGGIVSESVGSRPDALTPSLVEAGRKLGIGMGLPNMPDLLLSPFIANYNDEKKKTKSPFSMELREELANTLNMEDVLHPALLASMKDEGFLSTLRGDKTSEEASAISGSREEVEARAREGAMSGAQTESQLVDPEEELKYVRSQKGNWSSFHRLTPSQKMRDLERQLKEGVIDDYEYKMQLMAMQVGDGRYQLDSEKALGGLTGDDFEVGHAFHGLNEDEIMARVDGFTQNLIGMGRVMRELRYEAHKYAGGEDASAEDKAEIDDKIKGMDLSAEDIIAFGNIQNATRDQTMKYQELNSLMNGHLENTMSRINARIGMHMKQMEKTGLSDIELVNAAMRYAEGNMGLQGYANAFVSLLTGKQKDGTLDSYNISRLLKYLRQDGLRHALDEEHHQKSGEQIDKFQRNHHARKAIGEMEGGDISNPPEEYADDILNNKEQCLSCHEDRFGNRTKEESYLRGLTIEGHRGPTQIQSPYAQKTVILPNLKSNKDGFIPLTSEAGRTSLTNILHHIYPDEPRYHPKTIAEQQARADAGKYLGQWRKDKQNDFRRKIKEAVITGHPRAANIFKKFGLYKTIQHATGTGPAGMSNKELSAISFLLNNNDALDKYHEVHRKKTLMATRVNAIEDAMDFMQDLVDGVYGKKIKPGALLKEDTRRAILADVFSQPMNDLETYKRRIESRKKELATTQKAADSYKQQKAEIDELLFHTTPRKETDEDGVEREVRGKYQSPGQIAEINRRADELQEKYGMLMMKRRRQKQELKRYEKKMNILKDANSDVFERLNGFMLGAFIRGGGQMAKMLKEGDLSIDKVGNIIEQIHESMYEKDDFDRVYATDIGRDKKNKKKVVLTDRNDYTHSLDRVKEGRMGKMGGTGVLYNTNNKALPRVNNINQLMAHRLSMGFPLSEEEIQNAKNMMTDAEMIEVAESNSEFEEFANKMLTKEELAELNTGSMSHDHHDDEPDDLGLLSEAEAARREQNSHFTRGSEEAIANGDINAHSLMHNWREKAPTLCGTCHGHSWLTRDEAITYLRHRIPELRDESAHGAKMRKYIQKHLRPRGTESYAHHEMADEMDDDEHEQLACPACEHQAGHVRGGKLSNGICADCFGSGQRDPNNDEHIHEGHTHAETGEMMPGKNHHYTHNGATAQKFDLLNQLLLQGVEMRQSGQIPDFLREHVTAQQPLWDIYGDYVGTGKYQTLEQKREAQKKKQLEPMGSFDEEETPTKQVPRITYPQNKTPAEQTPTIDFGEPTIDFGDAPSVDTSAGMQLRGVHETAKKNHEKMMLDKHINRMAQIALKYQPEMAGHINYLVASIQQDPAYMLGEVHGNDEHPLLEKIHKLQEIAEAHLVHDLSDLDAQYPENHPKAGQFMLSMKERNKLLADSRRLPINDDGELSLTLADIYGGNAPITFGNYEPLIPMHGYLLSGKEIREGLFEPGATHPPSPVTDKDIGSFYKGNKKVQKILKRRENYMKFKTGKIGKLVDAINSVEKPMVARKTTNLRSDTLDALLKEFGENPITNEMASAAPTYSDEALKAFKEKGAVDVNTLLTYPNQHNQRRALNSLYTQNLNQAIRELWQKFAIKKALQTFMTRVNNPLDYPTIPQNIGQNNFSQMIGENASLYSLLHDEAAKLLGYDDFDHFEKKFGVSQDAQIQNADGEVINTISAKQFKAEVMDNANHEDLQALPLGVVDYSNPEKPKFVAQEAQKLIGEGRNASYTPEEEKQYENAKQIVRYDQCPNWWHRNAIDEIMAGEKNKAGGFQDYNELKTAFEQGQLTPEMQKRIEDSFALAHSSHPMIQLQNHNDMRGYAYANDALNTMDSMKPLWSEQGLGLSPQILPLPPPFAPNQQPAATGQPEVDFSQ